MLCHGVNTVMQQQNSRRLFESARDKTLTAGEKMLSPLCTGVSVLRAIFNARCSMHFDFGGAAICIHFAWNGCGACLAFLRRHVPFTFAGIPYPIIFSHSCRFQWVPNSCALFRFLSIAASRRCRLLSSHLFRLLSIYVIELHLFPWPFRALLLARLSTRWRTTFPTIFAIIRSLHTFVPCGGPAKIRQKWQQSLTSHRHRAKPLYDLRQCNFDCAQTLSPIYNIQLFVPVRPRSFDKPE